MLLGLGDVVALTRSRSLHTGTPGQHTACMLPSASAGADMCSADAEQRRAARARPRLDGHQRGRRGQQQVQAGGQQLVAEQPRGVQHALQEVRQHLRAHPRSRARRQSALQSMLLRHVKLAVVRLWSTFVSDLWFLHAPNHAMG